MAPHLLPSPAPPLHCSSATSPDPATAPAPPPAPVVAPEESEESERKAAAGKEKRDKAKGLGFLNCGEELTKDNCNLDELLAMKQSQLRTLRVQELRVAMAALGMAVEGNKFEMDQKVREAVKAYQERQKQEAEEAEAVADSLEPVVDLVEQAMLKGPEAAVAELNTRALKLQCEMRQLSAMGTRQVLSKRLLTALRSEMPQEEKPPLLVIAREVGLEKAVQGGHTRQEGSTC
ncbi:hypothetical protein QJQ45_030128 [Haematococcus lacustris]|nr:hypothetical protein QJQ45_030128 [Haematococcus lacustris]